MVVRLWGRRTSFNVQKAAWLAAELGLEVERVMAGGAYGGLDAPEFLAMNPHGKVPVLQDGGLVVWESHAILRYLAAKHGVGRFWSEDPGERSWADRWLDWAECTLQPIFLEGVFWGLYRTPEPQRNRPAIARAIALSGEAISLIEQALGELPWLGGEALGLADIPVGALLYRYFELDIERPSLPRVEAWYERLKARPAYRAEVMIPFSELKDRLDPAGT